MADTAQRLSRLEESKLDLLEKMFDHAPAVLGILEEPDHRVHYINQTFEELFNGQPFVQGKPVQELWPELKNQDYNELGFLKALDHSFETGEYITANEYKVKVGESTPEDTGMKYFDFIFQPLKDPNEEVYGVVIIGVDITRVVEAREEISESKNKLKLALEGADLGFCEIDVKDGVVHFASEECLRHYGHGSDEPFLYKYFIDVIHPEDRADVKTRLDDVLEKDGMFDIEYRVQWRDKTVHWILFRGKTVFDKRGDPLRLCGITIDITSQKNAEQTLKEAIRLRDNFLSIASHELQTPITNMKTRTGLLEQRLLREGHHSLATLAGKINTYVDQLSELTKSLLDITRIKEGKLKLNKRTFVLGSLITETIETLSSVSHHTIIVKGQTETAVYADRFRVGQVLMNLLENAIKYSPEGDRIIVQVTQEEGKAMISVKDFGIGIPDEDREKIFERFFKGSDGGRQTYPGLGIGLYICAQIVHRHNGEIWVKDNPEGGSVFIFSLPADGENS